MKKIFIIIMLLTTYTNIASSQDHSGKIKIGEKAPNLVHIQKWIKGNAVTEFQKGKVYLIDMTLIACPGCVKIIPHLKHIAHKYRDKVEVIAIYVAGNTKPEFIEKFADRMGINYTVALDSYDNTTNDQWGVTAYPSTFIVDQEGKIASYGHSEQALESVLNYGHVSETIKINEDSLKQKQQNIISGLINQLNNRSKTKGNYGKLQLIDSLMPHVSEDIKYNLYGFGLMMSKYETLLHLNDSITADSCLIEQMQNTPKGSWYYLVSKFKDYVPYNMTKRLLPFNYKRFLDICDSAYIDSDGAFRFISRYQQALIMYRYNPDNNKDAAIKLLDLAIIDDPEQKELFEEAKSNIESHNKQYNQANEDWATLQNVINQNAIIKPSSSAPEDYASYIFMKEELGRDILAKTLDFWNKYKFIGDPRRLSAFKIYSKAHMFNLISWVDTNRFPENISLKTASASFRKFPRDFKAEAEWRKNRDNIAMKEMQWAQSPEYKEEIDWIIFTSNWGQTHSYWNILPFRNENPETPVSGIEDDYWKMVGLHYWEALWQSFNDHLDKYSGLPVIANRALDFLGALSRAHNAEELAKSYWAKILEFHDKTDNTTTRDVGIQALIKQAKQQQQVYKSQSGEIPVQIDPFTALDGQKVDFAKFQGKVILLNFWASWCKASNVELSELKILYDKYHDNGLEIIGICLDNKIDKERVLRILKEKKITWPQRFEGVGMNDSFSKFYSIKSLPTIWIIDKKGIIINQNAYGQPVEQIITSQLQK